MNLYPPKALSIFILYFIKITNLEYGFSLYKGEKKKVICTGQKLLWRHFASS